MGLNEKLESDYKIALKSRHSLEVSTLRLIKASMQKKAIDARQERLDDSDIIAVLHQQAKQRRETLDAAIQTGREDVVREASQELAIIERYLPEPMSEAELNQLVDEAIASSNNNMGQIMKYVLAKAAGRTDGKIVSQMVAKKLKV